MEKYSVSNPNIWFFKTVDELSESGVPRLRMLPGQFLQSEGGWIASDETLNTQSDMAPRSIHPVGTVFAAKKVELKKSARGVAYYSILPSPLICLSGGVTAEISDAYEAYNFAMSTPTEEKTKKKKEKKSEETTKEVGTSLMDKLLKQFPIPTIEKDNFYVEQDVWSCLLFNMHQGYNTMLVGDSGTGKTELAMLMGRQMSKNVKVFDMAAKQDPIASLIGVHRFDEKSVFDRADFTYALEEDGIVVLDELPRAPMNTNNILFPVLDSRRELNMDVASHGLRNIKVNPACRFIATANEGYEYTGNNVLDRALKERFQIIMVNYMPEEREIKLLSSRTNVSEKDATIIVKISRTIRDLRRRDDLSSSVSIRHSLYAADLSAAGMVVNKAMEAAFLPMFHMEDEKKKVRDLLSSR